MKIAEVADERPRILAAIVEAFRSETARVSSDWAVTGSERSQDWVNVLFRRRDQEHVDSTCTLEIKPSDEGFDLHLSDMYLPHALKGKGLLTAALSKIRQVPGLSGKCTVHVGMNVEGWKKIITRAGFVQVAPAVSWPPK